MDLIMDHTSLIVYTPYKDYSYRMFINNTYTCLLYQFNLFIPNAHDKFSCPHLIVSKAPHEEFHSNYKI